MVSACEIAIKAGIGKLQLAGPRDLESFIVEHLQRNRFETLDVGLRHALGVAKLPPLHRDPFDHLLVSQAKAAEDLPLVTGDPALCSYGIPTLW